MKKILLIIAVLYISINSNAGQRFLIETENLVNKVKLINSKIGKTFDLFPEPYNKTNFIFEVDDMEDIFLKFSNSLKIKLYSFNDRVETDWHPVEKEKEIAVKSFFSSGIRKDVKLSDFLINSFGTNHLNSPGSAIRGNNFFHTPDDITFASPEKLFITWKSDEKVVGLRIEDIKGFLKIYTTQTYNDTVLQYNDLPEVARKGFKNEENYCLYIKTRCAAFGYHENQLIFEIDSFCFDHPDKDLLFVHEQEVEIKWSAPGKETTVKVFDDKKKLVYTTQTNQRYLSINELKEVQFNYKRPYKIELTQGNRTISKNFYVLFNYNGFMKLSFK